MKKYVFITLAFLLLVQFNGYSQKNNEHTAIRNDTISADSLEYRLVVDDPGFETWLATQLPESYYSKDYYEQKNRLYVMAWNMRYQSIRNSALYNSYIDYRPNIDYGLDLNYKLFYYFKYFEKMNNVKLLSGGR
jgi:hypothetical protein